MPAAQLPLSDESAWRKKISGYWGQLTHVDKNIGKLLQILDSIGKTDDTIVTQNGWKMSLSAASEQELYNLNEDPLETKNLYSSGETAAVIESLTRKIRAWQSRTGDKVVIP